jgi:hypothetical protein
MGTLILCLMELFIDIFVMFRNLNITCVGINENIPAVEQCLMYLFGTAPMNFTSCIFSNFKFAFASGLF